MWCSDVVAKLRVSSIWLLCAVAAVLSLPALVHGEDTSVNVAICGSGAGAQLTIDTPANDSVVNQPAVQIAGRVANASQIDVSIDGQYNSTVPLGAGATSYSTTVQLSVGTHTISLVANDVCNMQDATASVVVTYQPQVIPGPGAQTPTTVDDGIRVGGDPITPDSFGGIGNWPVIGPLVRLGYGLAIALDFDTEADRNTLWRSILRFSCIVFGLAILLFGVIFWCWLWRRRRDERVREEDDKRNSYCMSRKKRWLVRTIGIALILLAFVV